LDGDPALGVAIKTSNGERLGTLIAYSTIIAQNEPYIGANLEGFKIAALTMVTSHELGHHMGIDGHDGHTEGNIFCCMYQDLTQDIDDNQHERSFYVNPHFCENHVNLLKSQN